MCWFGNTGVAWYGTVHHQKDENAAPPAIYFYSTYSQRYKAIFEKWSFDDFWSGFLVNIGLTHSYWMTHSLELYSTVILAACDEYYNYDYDKAIVISQKSKHQNVLLSCEQKGPWIYIYIYTSRRDRIITARILRKVLQNLLFLLLVGMNYRPMIGSWSWNPCCCSYRSSQIEIIN